MDERFFEMAEQQEAAARVEAIAAAARAALPETHADFDGSSCVECSADIPQGRLALGKVRCVDCQSVLEKRRAHKA